MKKFNKIGASEVFLIKLFSFIYILGSFCFIQSTSSVSKGPIFNNFENIFTKKNNRVCSIKIISNRGSKEVNKKILESIFLKPRSIFNRRDLESSKVQISTAYNSLYPSSSVDVKPMVKTNKDGSVEVVFKVDIQNIKIAGIVVKGNKIISSKKISSLLSRKPSGFLIPYFQKSVIDITEFSNSSELIKAYAYSIGLFDFKINSIYYEQSKIKTNSIYIVIDINEGERYKFGSIELNNSSNLTEIKRILNNSVVSGDLYNKSKIDYVVNKISELLIKKNLNNFNVKVSEVKGKNSEISIKVEIIEEKDLTILDSLSFTGNFTTPDHIIRRKMKLSPGDPISFRAIKNQENLLLKTGLFSKVNTSTIPLEGNKVALNFSLEEVENKAYIGGSLKGDDFGLESSITIPNFYNTGSIVTASGYLSRSPNIELSISDQNAFGLGIDLNGEIGFFRSYRWSSLFGHPETISEFVKYLFTDKWYIDTREFISKVRPFLEQNSSLESFKMPYSITSNWKENYFLDTFENSIRAKFNILIPGQKAFLFSIFTNFRNFNNQQYGVPVYLETEIKNREEKRRKKNKEADLTNKELEKILQQNTDKEIKAIRLFEVMPTNKYELGASMKYSFSDSYLNTMYNYSSEIGLLTGTTSALKLLGSCFLSQALNEYILIEIEANAGFALSQSFIDNFTSEISGFKYGPIELYRFTFLGGRKFLNLSGRIFLNILSSDGFELILKNSISLNSIWDSGISKNRLPENLCRKRGWSKNSVDIAVDDFSIIPLTSIGIIGKFSGLTFANRGSLVFSISFNKPITKNPFIRYSPIDISFGFGNN